MPSDLSFLSNAIKEEFYGRIHASLTQYKTEGCIKMKDVNQKCVLKEPLKYLLNKKKKSEINK